MNMSRTGAMYLTIPRQDPIAVAKQKEKKVIAELQAQQQLLQRDILSSSTYDQPSDDSQEIGNVWVHHMTGESIQRPYDTSEHLDYDGRPIVGVLVGNDGYD
jgi:hypothetical protein